MSLLRVDSVDKSYGDEPVLHDVSFAMDRQNVEVIVGPSGSGKSTLLRCVNRLTEIDGGEIFLDDEEIHTVDGEDRELYVHRKGATRAFPAGREEVPRAYREVGQPVLLPGSMGTGSYVLRGGDGSLSESFGSTAPGAGRNMSRT